jgi:hypothetical protein
MILEILSRTPIWVFPLLALLLWLGVRDLRDRAVPSWQPVILAIVFPIISISTVLTTAVPAVNGLALLVAAGGAAAVAGWLTAPAARVEADANPKRVRLPGSFIPLAVIVGVFAVRYYFGYLFGRYPELRAEAFWNYLSIGLSAPFSGYIFGRNLRLTVAARNVARAPNTE